HETLVLRDTLGVTLSLLLLWWLAGCDDARALPWLMAGWLFALALLAREATLVFGPFVALWIARRFGRHPRALATVALAFVAGVPGALAPPRRQRAVQAARDLRPLRADGQRQLVLLRRPIAAAPLLAALRVGARARPGRPLAGPPAGRPAPPPPLLPARERGRPHVLHHRGPLPPAGRRRPVPLRG